jgi:hypothetical protein
MASMAKATISAPAAFCKRRLIGSFLSVTIPSHQPRQAEQTGAALSKATTVGIASTTSVTISETRQ